MEKLTQYLYNKYLSSIDPHMHLLCKFQSLSVADLSSEYLEMLLPLLIRNIVSYSAAKLQIKLSPHHLFMYQRQQKIQSIMKSANLHTFHHQWIENQLLPIKLAASKKVPNNPYVYVDKGKEEEKLKKQEKTVMINIQQITQDLQTKIVCDILKLEPKELNQSKDKDKLIEKAKWRKIQEYIYELFGQDSLMVFNFIKISPYIDEKQLLKRTMLPIIGLRKSVNSLVSAGFVNFYPQNARTILYKILDSTSIFEEYLNHICQGALNVHIYLDKRNIENRESMLMALSKLDDILILFGY